MKRVMIAIIFVLFLTSFVLAANEMQTNTAEASNIKAKALTAEQVQNVVTTRNRIRAVAQSDECPERCTCDGSVTRCRLRNGTREMVIAAGASGNTIVRVRGANMSTRVALYNGEDGEVYGVFRNNITRAIRVLPDEVQDKIRERIKVRLENQSIELDEDGVYQLEARKRARLFGFIRVKERVRAEVDSDTGEVRRVRNSWWGFLAPDETEDTE